MADPGASFPRPLCGRNPLPDGVVPAEIHERFGGVNLDPAFLALEGIMQNGKGTVSETVKGGGSTIFHRNIISLQQQPKE